MPARPPRCRSEDVFGPQFDIERRVYSLAGRQLHQITTAQMLDAGFAAREVTRWVGRGRLFRLWRGVYSLHPPPYSLEERWMAVVLAGGPDSLLSDWPGAIHLGIAPDGFPTRAHVTIPSARRRSIPGVVFHRREVDPQDRRVVRGIPITSPELVLIHLSPALAQAELGQMLVAAESKRMLDRRRLEQLVEERSGRPGTGRLVPLLERPRSIAESELELIMVPVLELAGVPWPSFNRPVHVPDREKPLIVDLFWPELRMVVELDSQRWHGDWERAEEDRNRDQLVALAGLAPHRFFRRQVKRDPRGTADRLRRLVDLRSRELAAQQRPLNAASSRIEAAE